MRKMLLRADALSPKASPCALFLMVQACFPARSSLWGSAASFSAPTFAILTQEATSRGGNTGAVVGENVPSLMNGGLHPAAPQRSPHGGMSGVQMLSSPAIPPP